MKQRYPQPVGCKSLPSTSPGSLPPNRPGSESLAQRQSTAFVGTQVRILQGSLDAKIKKLKWTTDNDFASKIKFKEKEGKTSLELKVKVRPRWQSPGLF